MTECNPNRELTHTIYLNARRASSGGAETLLGLMHRTLGKMRYRFNPPPSFAFLTAEPALDALTAGDRPS
jgi:hypothetical protein